MFNYTNSGEMIRPFKKDEDISGLFPVINAWLDECRVNEFGIDTEMTEYLDEAYKLIHMEDCDLLVMELKGEVIGLMGIAASKSPLGTQQIAHALYWYTLPEHRGKGISFMLEARKWANARGCSHIIFNASNMGSQLHDRVCQIYEKIGMMKFETTYIQKLKD
jgi:GNAT superfamily N-acetyltransferase